VLRGGATVPGQQSKGAHRVDRRFRSKLQIVSWFLLTLVVCSPLSWPSQAQMGSVRVVFTKLGLIGGAGAGHGVLTYRGREYPFRVSGLSLGIAAGASTNRLVGRVSYLQDLRDFPGIYDAVGVGGALAGGVSGVQLKNAKGVMISLRGAKLGLEASANLSKVNITLE
jgi:hypothetical protein